MSKPTDKRGEINRHSGVDNQGHNCTYILVYIGSPLCEELERCWLATLCGDIENPGLFWEPAYVGQVVDWFAGDGIDTPVVWSYDDRIEWHLVDVDTGPTGRAPWWTCHNTGQWTLEAH